MMKPKEEAGLDEGQIARLLAPIPLEATSAGRMRERLGREVERRRQELVEGAFYGGFALAAVAWAFIAVLPN